MYKRQTVNSEGVINSLAGMDYIFTPISADKVVLESSLSFAMAIQKLLVRNEACRLAGLYPVSYTHLLSFETEKTANVAVLLSEQSRKGVLVRVEKGAIESNIKRSLFLADKTAFRCV